MEPQIEPNFELSAKCMSILKLYYYGLVLYINTCCICIWFNDFSPFKFCHRLEPCFLCYAYLASVKKFAFHWL